MGKAQSSMEFIILIGFAMVGFTTLLWAFQTQLVDMELQRDEAKAEQIFNIVETEILLARGSPGNYTREFELPRFISGVEYEISFNDGREVNVRLKDNDYVHFLTDEINESELNKGSNFVKKVCYEEYCEIHINHILTE